MLDFGARLRMLRAGAALSQRELAAMVDLSASEISKLENGVYRPGTDIERRLREALNWTAEVDEALDRIVPEQATR